jgi:DNA-directed RNA polymerase specialized sigma subunit
MQPYLIAKVKSKYIDKVSTVSFEDYHELEYYEEPFKIEDHSELIEEIEKMPKDMKHVIDLFYFKNLNQNECAAIMNISQPAFNKKLKRSIDYLKRNLSKEL